MCELQGSGQPETELLASILRKLAADRERTGYVSLEGTYLTVDCSWVAISKEEAAAMEHLLLTRSEESL